MPFWKAKRSDKQTDELVDRMAQEWKIAPEDARAYAEGRGTHLRLKDVGKPDELRQYQRSVTWAVADHPEPRDRADTNHRGRTE